MNGFLYHTFVHCRNKGDLIVTFNRIKRLLSQNSNELEDDKNNFYQLFQLLKLGLIDNIGNNSYSLTPSSLIKCKKSKRSLGVNLPITVVNKNREYIVDSFLGLTLFNHLNIDCLDEILVEEDYNFDSRISQLNSKNAIISNWDVSDLSDLGKIERLEVYNSTRNKWELATAIDVNGFLYKAYVYNQFNYNYVYFFKSKYFKINKDEYEKVNTLKLNKANQAYFKYNQNQSLLCLKNYFTYPIYLYRLLFLNHVMSTGQFPQNNQFKIELNQFKKITKTMSINYQII